MNVAATGACITAAAAFRPARQWYSTLAEIR
jgi:hypothetical protein